jgi:hypothetical protein
MPASAGYSGTPLVKKLGIKSGMEVLFVDPPKGYDETLGPLPDGVVRHTSPQANLDFIHVFALRSRQLGLQLPELKSALAQDGMLWISWPKKASKVPTDLSDSVVRQMGLDAGLVDVKVAAVDAVWSGLKFVYRLADRKP